MINLLDLICKNAAIARENAKPTDRERPCQKPKTLKNYINWDVNEILTWINNLEGYEGGIADHHDHWDSC